MLAGDDNLVYVFGKPGLVNRLLEDIYLLTLNFLPFCINTSSNHSDDEDRHQDPNSNRSKLLKWLVEPIIFLEFLGLPKVYLCFGPVRYEVDIRIQLGGQYTLNDVGQRARELHA